MRELADAGFAGAEVRNAPLKTEIIIRATQTKDVLGTAAFSLCCVIRCDLTRNVVGCRRERQAYP
jgi:ribosomal protein S3